MSLGRAFATLWGANAASNLADGLAFVSIPLLATSFTDDPRLVAGLATLYAMVRLLVALPIGVWVDRLDRRTILIVANLFRGSAVIALAICVQLDVGGLILLYVVYGAIGTLESAADNASVSLVPNLVEKRQLDSANGRISAAQLVADEFVGPPLGGFLFALAAAAPVYAMGGLWAAAGIVALALPSRALAAPDAIPTKRPPMWKEAVAGASWLARHRIVGSLAMIGALASVGYMLTFSILVIFVQDRLGVSAAGYGVILSVSALGGLIGSFTTARIRLRIGYRWTIVASLILGAVSLFVLATTTNAVIASASLVVYIFHAVVWGICSVSLRQRLVPEPLRGRVNATAQVLGLLGLALGSFSGGLLAVIHIALPVAVGGGMFITCAFAASLLLRNVDDN
ncbi:MFS transporter [Kocuria indica]|uniref:MFS transporter n=1 Tax=Kocuria marina subsp. indica TaxID=1049583 RepID=A0A6N9QXU1_9MICC|nr:MULTISPECIES: MFS transporter [Kocuria]MCT1615499.1 MFS transporter [Kocuria marina]NDO77261.1 MFS transporter [Kocuria indica]